MSEFRDKASEIRKLGASILGMCVESDRAHKAFADQLNLDFPLLSDFGRRVVREYGIDYDEEHPFDGKSGMSKRSVFVIAPDGTVRYKWVTEDPTVAPDVWQVLEALRDLRQTAPGGGRAPEDDES